MLESTEVVEILVASGDVPTIGAFDCNRLVASGTVIGQSYVFSSSCQISEER